MRIPSVTMLCSVLALSLNGYAQNATVRSATEQQWSGGIAGRWGVRYTFKITFPADQKPTPDTIWVGRDAIALVISHPGTEGNTIVTKRNNGITWNIAVSIAHDNRYQPGNNEAAAHLPRYQGVALLLYTSAAIHRTLTVKTFTTRYPSLSYP
jgi:hypothetical protein